MTEELDFRVLDRGILIMSSVFFAQRGQGNGLLKERFSRSRSCMVDEGGNARSLDWRQGRVMSRKVGAQSGKRLGGVLKLRRRAWPIDIYAQAPWCCCGVLH